MNSIFSAIGKFFSYVFEALSNYSEVQIQRDGLQATMIELKQRVNREKAWAAYWIIAYAVNLAVYIRNSLGRGTTYCNVCAYDIFDYMCNTIWKVQVQVGETLKIPMAMGNQIYGFDFDLRAILRDHDPNTILRSPIPLVYENALQAIRDGEIRSHTPRTAQIIANTYGVPSMIIHPGLGAKKIGHVATVAPYFKFSKEELQWDLLPYDPNIGCWTGNAGWINGMMSFKEGFAGYLDPNTLQPVVGEDKCIQVPAIIIEFRDRVTGSFLTPDVA